jgi:hypothetical protein
MVQNWIVKEWLDHNGSVWWLPGGNSSGLWQIFMSYVCAGGSYHDQVLWMRNTCMLLEMSKQDTAAHHYYSRSIWQSWISFSARQTITWLIASCRFGSKNIQMPQSKRRMIYESPCLAVQEEGSTVMIPCISSIVPYLFCSSLFNSITIVISHKSCVLFPCSFGGRSKLLYPSTHRCWQCKGLVNNKLKNTWKTWKICALFPCATCKEMRHLCLMETTAAVAKASILQFPR